SLNFHAGNLVRANDTTPLVVINQIAPVYVQFAIPERDFQRVRAAQRGPAMPVSATPQGNAQTENGTLAFVDNAVHPTTGTIALKATFANPHRILWPGQYVNVAMKVGSRNGAVVIPAQAVQTGQRGQYVYDVKDGNGVEMRPVTVAQQVDQEA